MEPVKRLDWKCEALPSSLRKLSMERTFAREEMDLIRCGLLPREMEDKWFIFFEKPYLYLHRSWTGTFIYRARFEAREEGYVLVEIDLNSDTSKYKSQGDAYESAMLSYLIDRLLLSRQVQVPVPDDVPADHIPVWKHNMVGYGRSNNEK